MSDYKLTREEQETVIRGNAASQEWEILTADPRIIRKVEKQGYRPDDRQNPWGYVSFTLPWNKIRIGKAEKRKPNGIALRKRQAKLQRPSPEMNSKDELSGSKVQHDAPAIGSSDPRISVSPSPVRTTDTSHARTNEYGVAEETVSDLPARRIGLRQFSSIL